MQAALTTISILALGLMLGGCTTAPATPNVAAGPGISAGDAFGIGMQSHERHLVIQAQASVDQTPR